MMWDHNNDSAYHFDAELFGIYLKEHHCQRVQHVVGHVDHVVKTEDGYIKAIVTAEGSYIEADMYIDCTGFKSLLLEGFMGSEWESFKDVLFNDRAVATQIPYKNRETEWIPILIVMHSQQVGMEYPVVESCWHGICLLI